jgi:hypothetical protein
VFGIQGKREDTPKGSFLRVWKEGDPSASDLLSNNTSTPFTLFGSHASMIQTFENVSGVVVCLFVVCLFVVVVCCLFVVLFVVSVTHSWQAMNWYAKEISGVNVRVHPAYSPEAALSIAVR